MEFICGHVSPFEEFFLRECPICSSVSCHGTINPFLVFFGKIHAFGLGVSIESNAELRFVDLSIIIGVDSVEDVTGCISVEALLFGSGSSTCCGTACNFQGGSRGNESNNSEFHLFSFFVFNYNLTLHS